MDDFPKRLNRVEIDTEGYCRKKTGKDFTFYNANGDIIKSEKELKRILALVIPPAWSDVWICKDQLGHIQCTGVDEKQRKQYIYHPDYSKFQQEAKFARLKDFGERLPKIRKKIETDLEQDKWTKSKVLALIVHLLDEHYLRIGNSHYQKENDSYGITTIRRKHIDHKKDELILKYKAKSNKIREIHIDDMEIAALVAEISDCPGYEIFKYQENASTWIDIKSEDVNEYIHSISSHEFSAKTFRTWGGAKLAVDYYDAAFQKFKKNNRLKLESTLIKMVAKDLGNTVTVCRKYYIHPTVLKTVVENGIPNLESKFKNLKKLSKAERITMQLIH